MHVIMCKSCKALQHQGKGIYKCLLNFPIVYKEKNIRLAIVIMIPHPAGKCPKPVTWKKFYELREEKDERQTGKKNKI